MNGTFCEVANGHPYVSNDLPLCKCQPGLGLNNEFKIPMDSDCVKCEGIFNAAKNGVYQCVEQGIADGEDVNLIVNGTSALYQASRSGYFDIVDLLIKNGADLELKSEVDCADCEKPGDTALVQAVVNDHNEVMKLLVDNGANVNATNDFFDSRQVIHEAAMSLNFDAIELLTSKGASANAKDSEGNTVLMYVCRGSDDLSRKKRSLITFRRRKPNRPD